MCTTNDKHGIFKFMIYRLYKQFLDKFVMVITTNCFLLVFVFVFVLFFFLVLVLFCSEKILHNVPFNVEVPPGYDAKFYLALHLKSGHHFIWNRGVMNIRKYLGNIL